MLLFMLTLEFWGRQIILISPNSHHPISWQIATMASSHPSSHSNVVAQWQRWSFCKETTWCEFGEINNCRPILVWSMVVYIPFCSFRSDVRVLALGQVFSTGKLLIPIELLDTSLIKVGQETERNNWFSVE